MRFSAIHSVTQRHSGGLNVRVSQSSTRLRRKQIVTAIGSTLAHAIIVGLAFAVPLLYFTEPLPKPPDMLAFVVASPTTTTTTASPARATESTAGEPKVVPKTASVKVAMAAPLEAPSTIAPERPLELPDHDFVAGGVEGGVVGGSRAALPAVSP